jgi:NAD(P)H dehydrogenase (quinone)
MLNSVVVYHSSRGHTEVVAKHVAEGAKASLISIDQNGEISEQAWQTITQADAIIFGSPTHMGNVSWQFKKFADTSSRFWFSRSWENKVFGGFTNSASPSGDKQVALIALQTLASQHGGIWVSLGLPPSSTKAASSRDINNLGGSVGLLARSPADASVNEIHTGDLDSAVLYGKRIAHFAQKLTHN